MTSQALSYHGYRFPPEIISHAVWLYHRFSLSFRDAEDLLAQRGIIVTYETIRRWCRHFGPAYARTLRRRRGRMGDTWHVDELFITLQGQRHYLWQAVDEDGDLLDILVQSRRNRRAAVRFFRQLLKRQGCVPRRLITDKRRSYPAAHRTVMPSVVHRTDEYLNNRAEVSHQPTTARTADATVQVSGPAATVRVGTRCGAESLSRWPPPAPVGPSPFAANAGVRRMGDGDVCFLTGGRATPRPTHRRDVAHPPGGLRRWRQHRRRDVRG